MAKKVCITCDTAFVGEENSKFCSPACKQSDYRKRKTENKENGSSRLSLEEFKKVIECNKLSTFEENFVLFGFYRKNVPEQITIENLILYLTHTLDKNRDWFDNQNFLKYQDKFDAGEIEIVENY